MDLCKKLLKYLIFIGPMVCGTIGFCLLEGDALLDGLFNCVLMYTLNYDNPTPNALVEIARWTAPIVSAYSVVLVASKLRKRLHDLFLSRKEETIAVYGPEELRLPMVAALGKRGLSGGDAPAGTGHHILLWDEAENIRFYNQNRHLFAGKEVFIKCQSLPAQTASEANLHVFCPQETAARVFWKENCLFDTSCKAGHHMQIVMIGFGQLGSELLTYGLQNNIFSPDQQIEYHIFGGDPSYLKIHHNLNGVQDPIVFHEESWQDALPLLEHAENIILLQQDKQTEILTQLLLAVKAQIIDVFSSGDLGIDIMDGRERIRCFNWRELAFEPDHILSEKLFRRARSINLRYAHLYAGVAETEENMAAEWNKLDTFTRYSNISSADYQEIRQIMLRAMGEGEDPDAMSTEMLEFLAELEHMRWCRYHWLNNWSYGIPENGKNKDSVRRIHVDLKPFDQLSEKEKQKDRDTIRLLMELEREADRVKSEEKESYETACSSNDR